MLYGLGGVAVLVVTAVAVLAGCSVYLLPWLVARLRRHPRAGDIFLLNFFFGWTVVGWLVALEWAFRS
jgi:hypothetical protein